MVVQDFSIKNQRFPYNAPPCSRMISIKNQRFPYNAPPCSRMISIKTMLHSFLPVSLTNKSSAIVVHKLRPNAVLSRCIVNPIISKRGGIDLCHPSTFFPKHSHRQKCIFYLISGLLLFIIFGIRISIILLRDCLETSCTFDFVEVVALPTE